MAKSTILIGGDTRTVGPNQRLFQKGDAQTLLGDLLPEFLRRQNRVRLPLQGKIAKVQSEWRLFSIDSEPFGSVLCSDV